MSALTVPLLVLLGIGLVVMMLAQGLRRRVDLFSVRNIYLAGFIVYQVVSPVSALRSGNYAGFRIVDPEKAARTFTLFAYVYIAIFLLTYHRLGIANWFAAKFPRGNKTTSDSMLTGLAIALVLAAIVLRFVGIQINLVQSFALNVSVAMAAAACAIMGWVWGARRMNPAVILLVVAVMGVGLIVALTGVYSRRPLISMFVGFAWGAYYRWARHLSFGKLAVNTAPLILVAIIVVGAFTAVRGRENRAYQEAQDTVQAMRGANVSAGTADLLGGQTCGSIAFWVFEKFPDEIDYKPLFSFKYMAYYFVPRQFWEEKPQPFSKDVATLARLRGVNRSLITLPPGVVGYAGAEGGLIALIAYAVFFGQFTRFFDELIRLNPGNPIILLSIGCNTGQFVGLARGDIAIFTNLAVIGFASTFLLIYVAGMMFGRSRTYSMASPWPQMQ